EMGAYVPPEYDAYLNGRKLQVNPQTHEATAKVDGGKPALGSMGYHIELTADSTNKAASLPKGPAQLIAFRRSDTPLDGLWIKLPWYGSIDNAKWITGNDSTGYRMNVGSIGRIIGKIPQARSVHV